MAGDTALVEFAAGLRKLREEAGRPSYRELSARAHYSVGALSDAASGRRLPSLPVTLAYVGACGGNSADWSRRWHELAADQATAAPEPETAAEPGDRGPYPGAAAFGEADTEHFAGRAELVGELAAVLRQQRFVALVGASGAGKTSVLRAGLAPRFPGTVLVLTPRTRPVEVLAAALAALVHVPASTQLAAMRADPASLHLTVLQALWDQAGDRELLLVVDQFEELYTRCADEAERRCFLRLLRTAVEAPDSRTRVVLGLRAGDLRRCAEEPELAEVLRHGQVRVRPMTAEDLHLAVTEPAARAGCRVETALVSALVAECLGRPGELTVLAGALGEIWRRRRGITLTLAGHRAVGGIGQVLGRAAETAFLGLDTSGQHWARQLLTRMVAVGECGGHRPERLPGTELDLTRPGPAQALAHLVRHRVVTVDERGAQLVHEALVESWPRLRGWLAEDREALRLRAALTRAAGEWEAVNREPSALYRGTRLALALRLLHEGNVELSERERVFLVRGQAAEQQARLAASRRFRLLLVLLVLLVAAAVAVVLVVTRPGHAARTGGVVPCSADVVQTRPPGN